MITAVVDVRPTLSSARRSVAYASKNEEGSRTSKETSATAFYYSVQQRTVATAVQAVPSCSQSVPGQPTWYVE